MNAIALPLWLSLLGSIAQAAYGQNRQFAAAVEALAVGGSTAYQAALARPDAAIAKSLINEKLLKGEVGEALRDQTVGRYRHASGKWHNVMPRSGPQGLDHVSVQLDEHGNPRNLMVDETKWGSSRLAMTEDGRQMSKPYVSKRLRGLAQAYGKIQTQFQIEPMKAAVPAGLSKKTTIPVPLSDSQRATFWRPEGRGPWYYDGPPQLLPKAVSQLGKLSGFLQDRADGKGSFPSRVFRIKPDPDNARSFTVRILDAESQAEKGLIRGSLDQREWRDVFQRIIAKDIAARSPLMSEREVQTAAQERIAKTKSIEDLLTRVQLKQFAAAESIRAGVAGALLVMPIELASQLFQDRPVDWSRVAGMGGLAGASAGAGSVAGNATTFVLMRPGLGSSASVAAAEMLGLKSASRFANVSGGVAGGGVAAILFAYGGWGLGYYDLQSANRSAAAGVVGAGAGAATSAAALALIGTYATASTGTAIASLGGTAAFNASMAWLGGGSLATGGFGMAGGAVVMGTGVGLVIVGVSWAVLYGFHAYDGHQDEIRLERTLNYLAEKQTFFLPEPNPGF